VGNQTAVAEQVVTHHIRNRTIGEEGIAAKAACDLCKNAGVSAGDKEAVVTGIPVDLHRFHSHEADVKACPENTIFCDDEVVIELGTNHDDRVEAVATIDVHGGVHRVLNQVGTGTTGHIGALSQILLRAHQSESSHQEAVVTVVTEHGERRKVAVDNELIIVIATKDLHRLADSVGEEATSCFRSCESIGERNSCCCVALRFVQLANLKKVLTGTAVDVDLHTGIVNTKGVVSA